MTSRIEHLKSHSIASIFKIGVGPSSSHTMGPWRAAQLFVDSISKKIQQEARYQILVELYGSLALTGDGHGTDFGIFMGLNHFNMATIDNEMIKDELATYKGQVKELRTLSNVVFDPSIDIVKISDTFLKEHANGMTFKLVDADERIIYHDTYFSIGGGFVLTQEQINEVSEESDSDKNFPSATSITQICETDNLGIIDYLYRKESQWWSKEELDDNLYRIYSVMVQSAQSGCGTEGILPGGIGLERRAKKMHDRLMNDYPSTSSSASWIAHARSKHFNFAQMIEWISCCAIAVNEENASFKKIVTAPTNGSAGVIPAVLLYAHLALKKELTKERITSFLMVSGLIGQLYKQNATLSAAAGGCQAEIGVSSSMAAGGLTYILGGNLGQVFSAAEIAMEHHLGMTCDPVDGLVQIPCIERNSMGAIKAITSAQLAIQRESSESKVSLDEVIHTMWETAIDMNNKYKETSLGGLATNVMLADC